MKMMMRFNFSIHAGFVNLGKIKEKTYDPDWPQADLADL